MVVPSVLRLALLGSKSRAVDHVTPAPAPAPVLRHRGRPLVPRHRCHRRVQSSLGSRRRGEACPKTWALEWQAWLYRYLSRQAFAGSLCSRATCSTLKDFTGLRFESVYVNAVEIVRCKAGVGVGDV